MIYNRSVLVLGLLSLAFALAVNNVPVATLISNNRASFGSFPTPAPDVEELRRRQSSQVTQETLLAAPDNTCGYFGGSSASPWGCQSGNCVFATPTAVLNSTKSSAGNVLCCDPTTGCPAAPAPTACVDRGRNEYNTSCTGSCPNDPMTLKCTSGIYLYCNTITFTIPDISAFFCNYISTYDPLPAETSFAGQVGHAFTTTVARFATTTVPTTSHSSTAAKSLSTGTSSAAAIPANSGVKKKVNKGAIIGGIIGGVLGLALLVGVVIMFLRWRNIHEPVKGQSKRAAGSKEDISGPTVGKTEPVVTANPK